MAPRETDAVDRIIEQWGAVSPDLDLSPTAVIGRISRLSRLIDKRLSENFARHGIDDWMYDVLATLRRSGEPFELSAGDLVRQTMITTGAMTNRIDRLTERGFVQRVSAADRRKVIVHLTPRGRAVVDEVVGGHLAASREILAALSPAKQSRMAADLRRTLLQLGDIAMDDDHGGSKMDLR